MDSVGKLIQRVLSLYSKGVPTDDVRLSDRHIYHKLSSVRSRLIVQKNNKKQKINQWNYQTLPCVEMIVAPKHECPCLPPAGCTILRSKYKLPRPLTGLSGHLIQYVTSLDGSVKYDETSWNELKYKKGNKYTKFNPEYFIRNGYLYIIHKLGPKVITISGIFDDPIEAKDFPSICKENCVDCNNCTSYLDYDFPIDSDLIEPLIEITNEELINQFSQSYQDKTNNTKDDNFTQNE